MCSMTSNPPSPSASPSPPSIFRPWQPCSSIPVTSTTEASLATTTANGITKAPSTDSERRCPKQVATSSNKRFCKMTRTEGRDALPPAPQSSKPETSSQLFGFNPHLTPNPIFPGFGPFGSFPGAGPLVPLLDMLVPAAEVERVCARRPRPKRFGCSQCGSAFSNKGQLKGHLRIHTGERPFVCGHPGCQKRFTRNEELTRHRRIHSGARPFPCPLCDKRFGRKDHLKKHVRTHQRLPSTPVMHLSLTPHLTHCLTPTIMPPLATTLAASQPLLHRLQQLQQLHSLPHP